MTAAATDGSRRRLRIATGTWFAVLMTCLLATDMIARLDPRIISIIVVVAATIMFTCMQVIVGEMSTRTRVVSASQSQGKRVVDLAAMNLVVVAILYAIFWSMGALPF